MGVMTELRQNVTASDGPINVFMLSQDDTENLYFLKIIKSYIFITNKYMPERLQQISRAPGRPPVLFIGCAGEGGASIANDAPPSTDSGFVPLHPMSKQLHLLPKVQNEENDSIPSFCIPRFYILNKYS